MVTVPLLGIGGLRACNAFSPMKRVEHACTPTLILQGKEDTSTAFHQLVDLCSPDAGITNKRLDVPKCIDDTHACLCHALSARNDTCKRSPLRQAGCEGSQGGTRPGERSGLMAASVPTTVGNKGKVKLMVSPCAAGRFARACGHRWSGTGHGRAPGRAQPGLRTPSRPRSGASPRRHAQGRRTGPQCRCE